jgi:hypothetical protein
MFISIIVKAAINTALVSKITFIPADMFGEMLNKMDVLNNYLISRFNIPNDCDKKNEFFDNEDYYSKFFTVEVNFLSKDGKCYKCGWLIDAVFLVRDDIKQ